MGTFTAFKVFGRCESFGCRRLGFFIRRRWYDLHGTGMMLGKTRTCSTCDRHIKRVISIYDTRK